jgi:hypothetical protein
MLYKKHNYPYGFLAIEVAVKLQELLEPDHKARKPYEYSSEALEVVDVIVRKKIANPTGIQDQLAKTLSAMFDCDYQPSQFADIADFMSDRIEHINAYN